MILYWRRKRASRCAFKANHHHLSSSEDNLINMEIATPPHFQCPISFELMKDPVTLSTGITYDRESIEKWIQSGNQTCPVTNQVLTNLDQIPNHALRRMIQDWCVENHSRGVERIPTPRIPVTCREVFDICSKITAATQRGDQMKCVEMVGKLKAWGRESERNKLCIIENGAGFVLSVLFDKFASVSIEEHQNLLGETLSALNWMFPLGSEGRSNLGSKASLRCMAWFLKGEDLSAKQNAVVALKNLLSLDQTHVNALAEIDGVDEALVRIIQEEQNCPAATKASLKVIYCLTSQSSLSEKITSRFVELGLISLVLEILVGSGERSMAEKALGVLDGICSSVHGMEMARSHALTLPVLVKKLLKVSDTAMEFSVSVLWKLCKSEGGDDQLAEILQLNAFQKLLVVLQVNCGEKTKEKATELLKLLNRHRNRLEYCFDSSLYFMHLKRP